MIQCDDGDHDECGGGRGGLSNIIYHRTRNKAREFNEIFFSVRRLKLFP